MDEDVIDVDQLIECVGLKPCIWNRSLPEHPTRSILINAWRSVAAQMNAQFSNMSEKEKETYCKFLQKKWRNIRDQWAKSCKKVADQRRAGTPARHIKHYVYHDQLHFLHNNGETDSNAQENINSQHSDTSDSKDLDAGNNSNKYHRDRTSEDPKEQQWKKQKLNNDSNLGKWNISLTEHDPKLYFFKSILPSIEDFSVDEMLEFQSGIIDLIKGIKVNRYYQPPLENDCGTTKECSPSDNWQTTDYQKNFATPRDSPARSEHSARSSSGSETNDSSSAQHSDTSSSKDDKDGGNKKKDRPSEKPSNKVSRRPIADEIEKGDGSAVSDCSPNEEHPILYRKLIQRESKVQSTARKRRSLLRESKLMATAN